jgi:hypothetical protein
MEDQIAARAKPGRKSRAEIAANVTETPEFQVAVAAAVQQAMTPLLAQLAATTRSASGPLAQDEDWAGKLAMAISELTTQGTGKVRVSPEEMIRREKAREKMTALLIEARAERKVPTYQLRNKIYLNEQLIEPFYVAADKTAHPTEIDFWGVPNEVMVPVNDVAREIFAAFRESIGTVKGVQGVANLLPREDDIAITRGGLVVRNSAINSGMRKATPERPVYNEGPMKSAYEADDPSFQPINVHHKNEGGKFKQVAVLGTIHPPALQSG